MNIIFLDIDGVLNTVYTKQQTKYGFTFVEDRFVSVLKQMKEELNAEIVLSSTWREGWYHIEQGKESIDSSDFLELKDKLQEFDISLLGYTPPILDKYKHLCFCHPNRAAEIQKWLDNWTGEPIEHFVILDDYPKMKPLGKYFVRISETEGLQQKHIRKAKQIFQKYSFQQQKQSADIEKE